MKLREKQVLFAELVGQFIVWIYGHPGWGLSLDECYRPPETAALYAKQGRGIAGSLHTKKLAIDLNLFIDGVYQSRAAAYEMLGSKWLSFHLLCRWGGAKDSRHFSVAHGSVKF